ncbi:MAG: hypothetical protein V4721_00565 [Bacteroidota bacterium]
MNKEFPLYEHASKCPSARYVGGVSKHLCECLKPEECEGVKASKLSSDAVALMDKCSDLLDRIEELNEERGVDEYHQFNDGINYEKAWIDAYKYLLNNTSITQDIFNVIKKHCDVAEPMYQSIVNEAEEDME